MNALQSLNYFVPELVLASAPLAIVLFDLFGFTKKWLGLLSIAFLIAVGFLLTRYHAPALLFSGLYVIDDFSLLFKTLVLLMVGLPTLTAISSDVIPEKQKGEFFSLMLAVAFLLITMGSTTNLLMIFLATESVSITSYILSGFQKFNKKSSEAGLKYLLFGSVASATMLFGISLLFGLTGTLELTQMSSLIAQNAPTNLLCAIAALLFILVGLGFKISMAPFHMWAPDVYEGAPTPVTAFLTVAPKSLGFLVIFRILATAFGFAVGEWSELFVVLAILTMTIGNVVAVSQTNVKRLLAYSSIAQAGYILMGFAAANKTGAQAVFIYLITYLFTNLGAFLTVAAVEQSEKANHLDTYNGLAKRSPFLAFSLTIFLLSLAGIPPLAGFIAKWYVFAGAVQGKLITLAVVAALNSAVAGFYYFKIVKAMYLSTPQKTNAVSYSGYAFVVILIALAGTFAIGLFPSPILSLVANTLSSFTV
ncbi:MAG: NADH-quinone oxidoreductase subunit N [Candidatus Omnitrophica bacterium]|nr:NADH-quinone oxidoreductase subunit N [Candidatus Omnitrophota bacterium]